MKSDNIEFNVEDEVNTGLYITDALKVLNENMEIQQLHYLDQMQPQPTAKQTNMEANISGQPIHQNVSVSYINNQPQIAIEQVNTQLKRTHCEHTQKNSKRISPSEPQNAVPNQSTMQTQYSVPISNRFNCLQEENNQEPIQEHQIPPIYMNATENHALLIKDISQNITPKFETQLKNNKIRIQLKTIMDFRRTVRYLLATERQFHTYNDPANKKFSIVYKNTHTSFTEDDIFKDLKNQFYSTKKVTRLYKNNIPIPVVTAEFSGEE